MTDIYTEVIITAILPLIIFFIAFQLRYKGMKNDFIKKLNKFYTEKYPYLKGSKDLTLLATTATLDQAIDKIYLISKVDDSVTDAMRFAMSGDPSYLELSQMSTEALESDGVFSWIKGYVGERQSANVLSEQGYVVTFPDSSTEAGYDLIVDGTPYQVKTTLDYGYINEHIEKYPDIPVLVPEELASSSVAIHENVLSLPGFSYHATNNIATSGFEELSSLTDLSNSIPIPVLTSLVLGRKEYLKVKLHQKSKTEAVKDLTYGVVGSTAGGAVGGAVGLSAGSLAVAAGVGTVASWSTAAAVGGTIATAAGTKVGALAGGAAFLVLGPLGAIGIAAGGAYGGAMLGRKVVEKWQLRGVKEKEEAVHDAFKNSCIEFSGAIKRREAALIKKRDHLLTSVYDRKPFPFTFKSKTYNILKDKFNQDIEKYHALSRYSLVAFTGETDIEHRQMVLQYFSKYPIISDKFNQLSLKLKNAIEELTALLKTRGLIK